MAEFPELKDALRAWINDAINRLSHDNAAQDYTTYLGHWQRDSDGVVRFAERPIVVWDRVAVSNLLDLPSWAVVLDVFHLDSRLSDQVNTFVGTAQGGRRIEPEDIGRRVLPRPDELGQAVEIFEARYEELERFLAANEIEYAAIWPLPGLTSDVLPVQLESKIELDAMSDRELGVALDTEIVRTMFPREKVLTPWQENRTCVRYMYSLPKIVGDIDDRITRPGAKMLRSAREIEKELRQIESALNESLSIALPDTVGVAGRFAIESQPGSPLAGGVTSVQATLAQSHRLRRAHMKSDQASELVHVWTLVRQLDLQRYKGLALALRRLSYQAQREQPEDELLDTMIAAEALYLTELGDATERGELRYRLALRQCRLACVDQVLGLGRLQVGESDGGRPVVADGLMAWLPGGVSDGSPAFDDAGTGAVADGVEVRFPGHLGQRAGQEAVSLLRGERPGRRPGGRCGRPW